MTENAKKEEFTSSKIVTVQNFQTELEKNQQQNPLEIYLENCEIFSRENLHREQISIDEYDITYQDLEKKIFAEYNFDPDLNSQIVDAGSHDKINSKLIDKRYKQDQFNLVPFQSKPAGQQNQIKKQISQGNHLEQYQSLDIRIYKKLIMVNGKQYMIVKTWEKLQHTKFKIQFHIKTLRIYNIHMKEIFKTMTEQVDGEFNSENFYDISILQYNEMIFYFKRIQHYQGPMQECENVDQSVRSDISFESNSYLQLFQFNLLNNKESELEQYQIIEETQEDKQSFNIIFSQEFGNSSKQFQKYDNKIDFLNDQYFLAQKYIEGNEMKSFAIFQMNDFDNPIHHECHKEDLSCMTTKEILYVFHKKQVQNGNMTVQFVMISQDQHLHMNYNLDIKQLIQDIQIFSSSMLTKESQIHVQQENFDLIDQVNMDNKVKLFSVKQNYYIDQNNQVQLLYPNYRTKSQQFEAIEQIKNRLKIKSVNLDMYKIIYVNNFHQHKSDLEHCNNLNVAQEISHLKKILNLKYINKNQLFIFCQDQYDQVLYITEPEVNTITVIQMKNHHSVESETLQNKQKQNLYNGLAQQILNKSRKQLTRQQSNSNQIKAKMNLIFFLFVIDDIQQQEKMTIDVYSQQTKFLSSKKNIDFKNNVFVQMNLDLSKKQQKKIINKIKQYNKHDNLLLFSDNQGKLHAFQTYNPHAFQQLSLIKNKIQQVVVKSFNSFIENKQSLHKKFEIENIKIQQITKCKNLYSIAVHAQCLVNGIQKGCYFFIKKSINQIQELIKESVQADKNLIQRSKSLLLPNQQIQIINNKCELEIVIFTDLQNILQTDKYSNVRLDFENIYDYIEDFNFAVFIFQVNYKSFLKINSESKSQPNQNQGISDQILICVYDIQQKKIIKKQPVAIQKKKEKYLYKNDYGYNIFRIIRSTDNLKDNKEEYNYQLFQFYNEQLGRIKAYKFQISRFENQIAETDHLKTVIDYSIRLRGIKEIYMSQECIQKIDWSYFMKSQLIPFIDEELKTQGCQLLMKLSPKHCAFINLLDNQKNNLCSYRSDIAEFGYKRFELSQDDSDFYLAVITVNILDSLIDDNIFEEHEVELILRQMNENILQMRRIDFEYLLLNTFSSLIEKDFFASQEILNGKSICDICLSSPKILKDGLQYFKELSENRYREKSLASQIVSQDLIREIYFKESGIWPRERIITLDYNLNSTFYRAICQGANISLQILVEYIFSLYNCYEYCEIIMLELPLILQKDCKPIFEFFNITDHELLTQQKCSIEYNVASEKIDQFSFFQKRSFPINEIKNEINFMDQIIDKFYEKDQINKMKFDEKTDAKFSVQNSYIDFKWMFLGQKIKSIKEKESKEKLKFDHGYFSELMLKQEEYLQFYGLSSVQKIIDFQYQESQIYMKGLFYFYMIFFISPFILSMITTDKDFKIKLMAFQQISQIILLSIEIIQMYENKWDYFDGWNMIDLFQIILFQTYFIVEINEINSGIKEPYDPFIKMILIVTSFMKSLHFVTVFEEFGFFIKMLQICIMDLIPFIFSFVSMGLFYAILLAVLQVEIDDEIIGGKDGLGYFGLLYLSVWRNGLSKLGYYKYNFLFKLSDDIHDKLFVSITLNLIWILYFIQVISQFVVCLNLMIGMIESTYSKTMKYKYMYMYRNKAELNQECFQLLKYLKSLDHFRVIIFSYKMQDLKGDAVTMHKSEQEFFDLMDEVQTQIQQNYDSYKIKKCYSDIEKLKIDQKQFISKFDKEHEKFQGDIKSFKKEFFVQFQDLQQSLQMSKIK